MSGIPHEQPRMHPLARAAFILSLMGIPVIGLIVGPIAVILAGVALGQIAGNPLFRGRNIAMAAVAIGIGDVVLWVAILGLVIPRVNLPALRGAAPMIFPAGSLSDRARAPIKHALENNVFILVRRDRWPSFLSGESFSGSGVVLGQLDGDRLILTNRHVVDPSFKGSASREIDGSSSISAYFSDGSRRDAHIWWVAPGGADLALVTTGSKAEGVPVPALESSKAIKIGDKVFTVGNPHELTWSYHEGVVSAIRELAGTPYPLRILQTQTPINEGNSGGGLYSNDGTLIGIVTWTKDKSQAEGIGFAIAYESFLRLFRADRARDR